MGGSSALRGLLDWRRPAWRHLLQPWGVMYACLTRRTAEKKNTKPGGSNQTFNSRSPGCTSSSTTTPAVVVLPTNTSRSPAGQHQQTFCSPASSRRRESTAVALCSGFIGIPCARQQQPSSCSPTGQILLANSSCSPVQQQKQ